ncbi:hypothetical protein J132_01774 [Termitomyces sp. J132]|nr:hypothetical protein H2248_004857 [Termitomyces sp. 'cryptogamus']KNZ72782.1 hypothetical protein J132_01774 [Termitomyces sp. J132]
MYGSDSSSIFFPASESQLLSESPLPSSSSSHTGLGGDDLSLSELSLTDRTPVAHKPFSLLARTNSIRPDGSVDGDIPEDGVREETNDDKQTEHDKRHAAKLREDKLQSDIFILKKLNSSFALFNEALQDTGSANQRVAMQLEQTDALLNRYISILSKSEEFTRLIFDQRWQGAEADEEALEREIIAQRERARRDAEAKALAEQQEEERRRREEQEKIEKEERERVERENRERAAVRGGIRGVRGTRASMRGTGRGTTRAVPRGSTSIRGRSIGATSTGAVTSKLPMPNATATRTSSTSSARTLSRR